MFRASNTFHQTVSDIG